MVTAHKDSGGSVVDGNDFIINGVSAHLGSSFTYSGTTYWVGYYNDTAGIVEHVLTSDTGKTGLIVEGGTSELNF